MSAPRIFDVQTIRSSFGGGWVIPLTPMGTQALMEFFGEEPDELAPLGGTAGYIVEPWQGTDLIEFMKIQGLAVECEL